LIDTLKLHSRDFEVGQSADLKLRPGVVDMKTGEVENSFDLYKNRSGQVVSGSGAYLNTELFNLDISQRGLHIKFTPAKNFYGTNYYSINSSQLKFISEEIQKTLKESDIHLNLEESEVSRIDLCKNIHTDQPFIAYQELFSFLEGKRMKSTQYGSYFRYGNKSRQTVFYDKIEELNNQHIDLKRYDIPQEDTLRGELRFLNKKTVKRDLPATKLVQLQNKDTYEDMRDSYRHYIKDLVFRSKGEDKLKFNFRKEVELLKAIKEKSKRNAIVEYLSISGLEKVLLVYGSLENFRSVLLESGFQRQYTYRQIRQMQDRLELKSRIDLKYDTEENTLSHQYEEILTKLTA